jgi:hypothetical protein
MRRVKVNEITVKLHGKKFQQNLAVEMAVQGTKKMTVKLFFVPQVENTKPLDYADETVADLDRQPRAKRTFCSRPWPGYYIIARPS